MKPIGKPRKIRSLISEPASFTHIGLWAFLEPHKLSTAVHQSLGDSKNARFLSAVSVWEAILLLEKRRLKVPQDFGQWFDKSKRELSLTAGMSWKVARELRFTLIGCSDPADRFLVATARAYDMTLVTADARILRLPNLKLLPNV
jgi:PIN domain nuclease of toxin-antitoxin system